MFTRLSACRLHAPEILTYEIGNALSAMVKRRQLNADKVLPIYRISQLIPVRLLKVDISDALVIATDHNLYAYDAYFLQCSVKFGFPFMTLDRKLKTAAENMGIRVLEKT